MRTCSIIAAALLWIVAGPAAASVAGNDGFANFLYDDFGANQADGVDGPGGSFDGVDTSGLWGQMNLDVVNQTASDGITDRIEIGYSALDPTGTGAVSYDVTGIAFLFDAAAAVPLANLRAAVLNSPTAGITQLDWKIVFADPNGTAVNDGLPNPDNGVGSPSAGALIVDLSLAEDCGFGFGGTCGQTFGPGDLDVFTLQFNDGSLEGLLLTEIFDFAYVTLQAITPNSIGFGSLFLGGEILPTPIPAPIALLGSGLLVLFGFAGRKRRSTTG